MKNKVYVLSSLVVMLVCSLPFNVFADGKKQSIFDAMTFTEELEVNIQVDMEALTGDLRNEDKHASQFSFVDAKGNLQVWNTKLRLRGKYRRLNCADTPPMKIYFDKDDLKAAGFAKFNDLKLVNYCVDDKAEAKNLLLKEYMAYKIYNQLSDYSFRVQLLKVTYEDIKSNKKIKQWAFVIEDTAELRSRLNLEKVEQEFGLKQEQYELEEIQKVSLFQYLIGNVDWSLKMAKNIKIMAKDDKLIAIPYDFDFTGLVNPPYGSVSEKLGVQLLTERVYLGYPNEVNNLSKSIELYKEKKEVIFAMVKSNKQLNGILRLEIKNYLQSFYKDLSIPSIAESIPAGISDHLGLTIVED